MWFHYFHSNCFDFYFALFQVVINTVVKARDKYMHVCNKFATTQKIEAQQIYSTSEHLIICLTM